MTRKLTKRQAQILRRVAVVGTSGRMWYRPDWGVERNICERLERRGYLSVAGYGFGFCATDKGVREVKR